MESKTGNIYPPQGSKIDPKRRKRIDLTRKMNAIFLGLTNKVKVKIK
jgi:hypothetical protein